MEEGTSNTHHVSQPCLSLRKSRIAVAGTPVADSSTVAGTFERHGASMRLNLSFGLSKGKDGSQW